MGQYQDAVAQNAVASSSAGIAGGVGNIASNALRLFDDSRANQVYDDTYNRWTEYYLDKENNRAQRQSLVKELSQLGIDNNLTLNEIRSREDAGIAQVNVSAAAAGIRGNSVKQVQQQKQIKINHRQSEFKRKVEIQRKSKIERLRNFDNNNRLDEPEAYKHGNKALRIAADTINAFSDGAIGDAVVNAYSSFGEKENG